MKEAVHDIILAVINKYKYTLKVLESYFSLYF